MNEKDKELLYQTYLEGITKETQVPIIELEDIDFVLPEDVEFTFPEFPTTH
jgi:carbamoylphosphate synthase large subunit